MAVYDISEAKSRPMTTDCLRPRRTDLTPAGRCCPEMQALERRIRTVAAQLEDWATQAENRGRRNAIAADAPEILDVAEAHAGRLRQAAQLVKETLPRERQL